MPTVNIEVAPNESKIVPIFWFGDKNEAITVNASLDKPGSSLKLLGVFFARQNHLELKTNVVHKAADTYSRTIIKGVLDGTASANFEGMVRIEKGAKNADADLKEHTILLSPNARAKAIPRLDVLENEVKAGHGATVGRVDEEQLFYIMSRGLNLSQAKHIIVKGFLESLLSDFPQKEANLVREKIENYN
jgi:Fe-S cluster assembly protein SufD